MQPNGSGETSTKLSIKSGSSGAQAQRRPSFVDRIRPPAPVGKRRWIGQPPEPSEGPGGAERGRSQDYVDGSVYSANRKARHGGERADRATLPPHPYRAPADRDPNGRRHRQASAGTDRTGIHPSCRGIIEAAVTRDNLQVTRMSSRHAHGAEAQSVRAAPSAATALAGQSARVPTSEAPVSRQNARTGLLNRPSTLKPAVKLDMDYGSEASDRVAEGRPSWV
jgi:hypothetical protein